MFCLQNLLDNMWVLLLVITPVERSRMKVYRHFVEKFLFHNQHSHVGIFLFCRAEWLKLRTEYLKLQKENMRKLKQNLSDLQQSKPPPSERLVDK